MLPTTAPGHVTGGGQLPGGNVAFTALARSVARRQAKAAREARLTGDLLHLYADLARRHRRLRDAGHHP